MDEVDVAVKSHRECPECHSPIESRGLEGLEHCIHIHTQRLTMHEEDIYRQTVKMTSSSNTLIPSSSIKSILSHHGSSPSNFSSYSAAHRELAAFKF